MYSKKCSKCDSTLTKARIQSSPGTVGVNRTPTSVLNNNHNYSELIPYVCSSCGYVDFYVEEPGKFVE
ncbi:hypothetical protein C1N86_08620 [Priestia aryabhattai]